VTRRKAAKYVEALIQGRRPPRFPADQQDVEVIRTAIALRAARGDDAAPSEDFMSELFEERAEMHEGAGESPKVVPIRSPRRALTAAAAAVALVAGTAAVTEAVDHSSRAPAAVATHHSSGLRSVSLVDASRHQVGELNIYGGHPAWVFMNLVGQSVNGRVICELRSRDGAIVLSGSFDVVGGQGIWARTVPIDTSSVSSASIVAPDGTLLASATFATA
jgi:hypothetical protein